MRKALLLVLLSAGCMTAPKNGVKAYTFRVKPGEDLKLALAAFAKAHNIKAGSIVSCAGSLKTVSLRFANQKEPTKLNGFHEIVSLSGTLEEEHMHVHMSVSDATGKTTGGHLVDGNVIYTTAEITVLEQLDKSFKREKDAATGFNELVVEDR